MSHIARILLLGSGELGREFVISAKRLGAYVIACDAYDDAPAMQLADAREVFSMLDGERLRAMVEEHRPDYIVPEIEAIRTEMLAELESEGFTVVPSARAAQLTMNRDGIRDLAANELGLVTSRYRYAKNFEEVRAAAQHTAFPCVIKPVMSSSGKGQTTVRDESGLEAAWDYAVANMRGDRQRVIVEQFVDFDYEITLLTVRHESGVTFCPPIGHREERGDYQGWRPIAMSDAALAAAQDMARKSSASRGYGLFGVEFFVAEGRRLRKVIFSELSPAARYRHGHAGQPEPRNSTFTPVRLWGYPCPKPSAHAPQPPPSSSPNGTAIPELCGAPKRWRRRATCASSPSRTAAPTAAWAGAGDCWRHRRGAARARAAGKSTSLRRRLTPARAGRPVPALRRGRHLGLHVDAGCCGWRWGQG